MSSSTRREALADRTIILTGAAGGLGAVMAEAILSAGARLAALDFDRDGLERLEAANASDRLMTHFVDVADEESCTSAVGAAAARFGTVDGLVNLAGITGEQPQRGAFPRFWERQPADWRRVQAINHNGTFHMAYHCVPLMMRQGRGRIVNISTSLTTMTSAGMAAYGPSKAAIEASTSIWSKELEGSGVTANVLVPGGPVLTPSVPASWPRDLLLAPEVMLPPLLWLLSDDAGSLTGKRFIAREWDCDLDPAAAAAAIAAPAGRGEA